MTRMGISGRDRARAIILFFLLDTSLNTSPCPQEPDAAPPGVKLLANFTFSYILVPLRLAPPIE
jgi:hypothetical protein